MSDECWAVIPARAGSSGVKRKNIKKLDGIPLIAYSILSLQKSNAVDKIIVSSDSEEILSVADSYGAEIFLRSNPEESNDIVMPDIPVLSFFESIPKDNLPKFGMMIQCTAPFISPSSYLQAVETLRTNPDDTVFASYIAHEFLWRQEIDNNNTLRWQPINHPFHERVGRQYSKETQVNETGAFYGFPVKEFLKARHRFFTNAHPILINGHEKIDINNYEDWDYASFVIHNKNNNYEN